MNQANQANQLAAATVTAEKESGSMTFAVAELGAMKATVDSLAYSRNKTEQTRTAKLVVSFLSQMSRVRGGKALNNITLTGYATAYDLKEDNLNYTFFFEGQ